MAIFVTMIKTIKMAFNDIKCRVKWGYMAHLTLIPTSLGSCCQGDGIGIADIQQLH